MAKYTVKVKFGNDNIFNAIGVEASNKEIALRKVKIAIHKLLDYKVTKN